MPTLRQQLPTANLLVAQLLEWDCDEEAGVVTKVAVSPLTVEHAQVVQTCLVQMKLVTALLGKLYR